MKVYIVREGWTYEGRNGGFVKAFDTLEKARQCFENEVYDILNGGDYDNYVRDDGNEHYGQYVYGEDEWSFEIWKYGSYCLDNLTIKIYKVEVE